MRRLSLDAPAKINLHLWVGSKRADGYHSVDTVFQEISLCDTLRFEIINSSQLSLVVSGRRIPSGPSNLVLRALSLLRDELNIQAGMRVHLQKRIPIGAGLGGGSSDAAAALWGGWILWTGRNQNVDRRRCPKTLFSLAKKLGADVPFFLRGGRARGRGIGDRLFPLKSGSKQWLILVYPRIHVSTPRAYQMLDRDVRREIRRRSRENTNSFESVVFRYYPLIERVHRLLQKQGCHPVRMSGSGSSVFGFVKTKTKGLKIQKDLQDRKWDVFLVHTR